MFPNISGRPLLLPGGSGGSCFSVMSVPPGGKDWKVLEVFCNSWQNFIIYIIIFKAQVKSSNGLLAC